MHFDRLYAGFDKLDLAVQGALRPEDVALLQIAHRQALEAQAVQLVTIGPGRVEVLVHPGGLSGGYPIRADTGPLGEVWGIREGLDPLQWNLFVKLRAAALATYGYAGARDNLLTRLEAMGCTVRGHSLNRVDFAMDFATACFEPRPEQFVAPARSKVRPHWSRPAQASDPHHPAAVLCGRRYDSVTVGKLPGRQVIVYDKRKEALEKREPLWFAVWQVDPKDRGREVWRVELRAGRQELKERWRLRTFADLEASIGDLFRAAAERVRYVAPRRGDDNATRQRLHPLWRAVQGCLERSLTAYRSGLLPADVLELEREEAVRRYRSLVLGNLAPFAVALGMDETVLETDLPDLLRREVQAALNDPTGRLLKNVARARGRLRFVAASNEPNPSAQ